VTIGGLIQTAVGWGGVVRSGVELESGAGGVFSTGVGAAGGEDNRAATAGKTILFWKGFADGVVD
jgi:hypothetical protein